MAFISADRSRVHAQQHQAEAQAAADTAALAAMTYLDKRRAEYPGIQDQLDALWAVGMRLRP